MTAGFGNASCRPCLILDHLVLVHQAALCQEWVRFEREHGSAEEQLAAELKVEPILEAAAAAAITAADAQGAAAAQVPNYGCRAQPSCFLRSLSASRLFSLVGPVLGTCMLHL